MKELTERKKKVICFVFSALHFFTEFDTMTAFVQRGKVLPLRFCGEKSRLLSVFEKFCKTINVFKILLRDNKKVVCYMYV